MSIARKWSKDVFPHVFGVSFLYVVLIFWGVNVMKRREKFGLQRALVLWNAGLCWYSFFTLYRFAPQFWEEYRTGKWVNMICDISYTEGGGTAVWSFLFPVSKIFEFGDTAIRGAQKETAHLPPLVPSHYRALVLLVLPGVPDRTRTGFSLASTFSCTRLCTATTLCPPRTSTAFLAGWTCSLPRCRSRRCLRGLGSISSPTSVCCQDSIVPWASATWPTRCWCTSAISFCLETIFTKLTLSRRRYNSSSTCSLLSRTVLASSTTLFVKLCLLLTVFLLELCYDSRIYYC